MSDPSSPAGRLFSLLPLGGLNALEYLATVLPLAVCLIKLGYDYLLTWISLAPRDLAPQSMMWVLLLIGPAYFGARYLGGIHVDLGPDGLRLARPAAYFAPEEALSRTQLLSLDVQPILRRPAGALDRRWLIALLALSLLAAARGVVVMLQQWLLLAAIVVLVQPFADRLRAATHRLRVVRLPDPAFPVNVFVFLGPAEDIARAAQALGALPALRPEISTGSALPDWLNEADLAQIEALPPAVETLHIPYTRPSSRAPFDWGQALAPVRNRLAAFLLPVSALSGGMAGYVAGFLIVFTLAFFTGLPAWMSYWRIWGTGAGAGLGVGITLLYRRRSGQPPYTSEERRVWSQVRGAVRSAWQTVRGHIARLPRPASAARPAPSPPEPRAANPRIEILFWTTLVVGLIGLALIIWRIFTALNSS